MDGVAILAQINVLSLIEKQLVGYGDLAHLEEDEDRSLRFYALAKGVGEEIELLNKQFVASVW